MPVWRSCARILGTVPPRRLSQNSEYPRSPIAGYLQSPPLCPSALLASFENHCWTSCSQWGAQGSLGGLDAPSCCVVMTTGDGGKLSPWLQLCSCLGTQGRDVQSVPGQPSSLPRGWAWQAAVPGRNKPTLGEACLLNLWWGWGKARDCQERGSLTGGCDASQGRLWVLADAVGGRAERALHGWTWWVQLGERSTER